MHASHDRNSYPLFPPELLLLFGPLLIALPAGMLLPMLVRSRHGDPTLLIVALSFAVFGIILLFLARLPLYRCGRFFTFGPGSLDRTHRKLYGWAYTFIVAAVVLLGAIVVFLG